MRSFCIDWAPFGKKSLSVIRNSGVVAVQFFFFYCGNGDAIGTSVSVRYIVDVRSSGVSLSGVLLYTSRTTANVDSWPAEKTATRTTFDLCTRPRSDHVTRDDIITISLL